MTTLPASDSLTTKGSRPGFLMGLMIGRVGKNESLWFENCMCIYLNGSIARSRLWRWSCVRRLREKIRNGSIRVVSRKSEAGPPEFGTKVAEKNAFSSPHREQLVSKLHSPEREHQQNPRNFGAHRGQEVRRLKFGWRSETDSN